MEGGLYKKRDISLVILWDGIGWWRASCHKADLQSRFVKFMRIVVVSGTARRRLSSLR